MRALAARTLALVVLAAAAAAYLAAVTPRYCDRYDGVLMTRGASATEACVKWSGPFGVPAHFRSPRLEARGS